MLSERRLVSIFKTFVEKVFLPIPQVKADNASSEWAKFSNMLKDLSNLNEMQIYVDSLPNK